MIRLAVGYDCREAVVYHTFCQSLIETSTEPLAIVPLASNALGQQAVAKGDGSNAFTGNWLTTEYPVNEAAHLLHYTLGAPCFDEHKSADMAEHWHHFHKHSQEGMQ